MSFITAQVERDHVAPNRFERNRHGGVEALEVARIIVRKPIQRSHHCAARDREHGLPVRVIRACIVFVAGE